jgi:DNA-binding LacI/PurR family transcriptional regulator
MKIKKPKLFAAIILTGILLSLLIILVVFVQQASRPLSQPADGASASQAQEETQKNIVYISNDLSKPDEYGQVMLIKNYFQENSNLDFNILDSNGLFPMQINHLESLNPATTDLLIINPINTHTLADKISQAGIPTIYLNMQTQPEQGVRISFSDAYCAQLIAQHVFATIYPDSNISVIGTEKGDFLYQSTVSELEKVSSANGTALNISSYFTNSIEIKNIRAIMPRLLEDQMIILLDPVNTSSILQYLQANEYTGNSLVVSRDEKMIAKLLEGSLDAVVYREKEIFAKTVYKTSLEILNGSITNDNVDCYQGLLNIHNINQYLASKKNST